MRCPSPDVGSRPHPPARAAGAAVIIYNPAAADLSRLRPAVAQAERALGLPRSTWRPTSPGTNPQPLVERALAAGASVVVAAGGDGTVRDVGAALTGGDVPLGILPVGTANLLARNLALPVSNLRAAALVALGPTTRRIDAATVTLARDHQVVRRQTFFVMAGFGVDSDMVLGADPLLKRHLGWTAYVQPIVRSLFRRGRTATAYRLDDGHPVHAAVHTMLVGSCSTLAGGLPILPNAVVDDGLLDVLTLVSISPHHLARTVGWLGGRWLGHRAKALAAGAPVGEERSPESFRYATARQITVRLARPTAVEADGDIVGTASQLRFTVQQRALAVRVR
ncbi:diacylglycerol/lipid kinase family protein [Sanguibacter suarezii]|uniref:diacylglycerol/lipid kinase family protein n=1 Tax=Sanguibacter suarezii TaxID=60921 RepID=UPI000830FD86|nr:diacylglycerol kinase family protein [Sanguibacter suarezii]